MPTEKAYGVTISNTAVAAKKYFEKIFPYLDIATQNFLIDNYDFVPSIKTILRHNNNKLIS